MKITEKMKVQEALKGSKELLKVFNKYKLDCPQCKGSVEDTIEKVAQHNGLDLEKFIEELNSAAGSTK